MSTSFVIDRRPAAKPGRATLFLGDPQVFLHTIMAAPEDSQNPGSNLASKHQPTRRLLKGLL